MKIKFPRFSKQRYEIVSVHGGSTYIPLLIDGYPLMSKNIYVISKNTPDMEELALTMPNLNKADIFSKSYKRKLDNTSFHELKDRDNILYGGVKSVEDAKIVINLYKKFENLRVQYNTVKVIERI